MPGGAHAAHDWGCSKYFRSGGNTAATFNERIALHAPIEI
jgi:hypothetical protein